jgi:hypothetical protein
LPRKLQCNCSSPSLRLYALLDVIT